MRATGILRRFVDGCGQIHTKRRLTFLALLFALVKGGRLSVTGLGRAVSGRTSAKHSIKRAMRFVGNIHMYMEVEHVFSVLAERLIGNVERPVILIDWTPLKDGFYCLSAAVPIGGRALTIYEQVHSERDQNKQKIHNAFLAQLQRILPCHCVPIVVVDSGFRTPFFQQVRSMGWDFVGRLSNNVLVKTPPSLWIRATTLYSKATTKPKDLGWWFVAKTSRARAEYRLVCVRKRYSRKRKAPPPTSAAQAKAQRRNRAPWLLVTSLSQSTAVQVVTVYATRMQIEETFRDKKNHRFGWSLDAARSRHAEHWRILLLIAAVAMFALVLVGIHAERIGLHRNYQANTITKRRVLSYFFLATQVLQRRDPLLGPIRWEQSLSQCQQYLRQLAADTGEI